MGDDMMQKYVVSFSDHRILAVLGHLKDVIPEAKLTKLSLNCAEIECPVYEEPSLHHIFENEDCTFSKSRTYNLG